MPEADAMQTTQSFQLKGATVPLTALELRFFEPEAFEETLRDKIRQAPGFFRDIPLIIGLEKYEGLSRELDFFQLIGICRRHDMHIVAVRGGDDDQRRLARKCRHCTVACSDSKRVTACTRANTRRPGNACRGTKG